MPREDDATDPPPGDRTRSKVARLIDRYELGAEFGATLEARWTADGDERESLRDLADRFNRRLLEAALREANVSTIEGEVENLYRLLTDEDVSSGSRTEATLRLEQNGIDVDGLEQDFVTYQAIRSYLKDYRGAAYDHGDEGARTDSVVETLQRLQARARSVTERNLSQLRDANRLSLGDFSVYVEITVLCEDCNTQYGVVELLRQGGCACESAA